MSLEAQTSQGRSRQLGDAVLDLAQLIEGFGGCSLGGLDAGPLAPRLTALKPRLPIRPRAGRRGPRAIVSSV
ncbi:hypothetical protein MKL09_09325 [Methylobacterium sp. J-048]|nr:hypothetical protein [Methylobacterium sp. J-048]